MQEALDRHAVEPQSTLPRRKSLRVRSVTLEGVKEGTAADGPFDQTFTFGPGLWAIVSDENFRGKSTLLNMIQGGIRGDIHERVKPDVWRWLSKAEIVFEANGIGHRVLVTKEAGDPDKDAAATFAREQEGGWFVLYEGTVGKPLERAVEDAMLAEFGFARFHAHNKKDGSHTHGWQVIASALFVNGPGEAVFGELLVDAIPLRLLQMFMGLPWVSTYTAASTALKRLRTTKAERLSPSKGLKDRLQARLGTVEDALAAARGRVRPGPDRGVLRARMLEMDGRLLALRERVEATRRETFRLERQLQGATTVLLDTRRALQQLKDDRAAGVVLRTLRPVCCPSCDTGIDHDRHARATDGSTCALCGTRQTPAEDEDGLRLEELQRDADDVAANVAELRAQATEAQASQRGAEAELSRAIASSRALEAALRTEGSADLELEIRGLEAQREQLLALIAAEEEEAEDEAADAAGAHDEAVLKAAEEVTKDLYDGLAREILADVSKEITQLSRSFGVQNIESMDWGTGGAMRIVQGRAQTSFGKLSPGENLRVRIAAALAVIEVARQRMYGRHPGLLVLDSPGAQEMAPADFAALLSRVHGAIESAGDIQIIVGARAEPALLDVVPCDHVTHAQGERFLF
ncbi:FUSC family protein [Methylobacterium frigidaeris]|uniref:FUSC family protein n=1 Tax=Methylobacterium frigidaeris TaxID=2038277 RepID=UPI001EDD5329|nr:FUSC family protein [Methylobacterium frigidaeris]